MSLSDLYSLIKLPRGSNTGDRVKLTKSSSVAELHIGISSASISNYVLKPSPKLTWSHSIPPSYTITSIDEINGRYIAGIHNKSKKKNLIQVIERLDNDSKVLQEIEIGSKVLDIKSYPDSVTVVFEDSITSYSTEFEQFWSSKALFKAIFSQFIENDVILVVEQKEAKNMLNFRLISSSGLEISSKIIEYDHSLENLSFAYNDGLLYQYSNNSITLYTVPHFNDLKHLDLSTLSIPKSKSKVTILSPASNRLLLAQEKTIYLINTNFSIILSEITSKSTVELLHAEKSRGKSYSSNQQLFATVLKDSDISGISFSLDSNTLRDSLGKRFQKADYSNQIYKVAPSILDIKDETINVDHILKSKDLSKTLKSFLEAENDYYEEKDKIVSANFITRIVEHLLEQDILAESALTYLLTHPLFPVIDNLLLKLRSNPRLLRQAVVTGNVSIKELLQELETTDNDEIFKDIISRLLEFPKEKLNFKDLDNFKIVERIINLNYGYELISLLIDSSGLFTWSEELIEKLQKVLDVKVEALNTVSKTLAVIEQAEFKNLKTVKKIPSYSIEGLNI